MKYLLCLLAFSGLEAAPNRSLILTGGLTATATAANTSPWNSAANMRVEFRIHNFTGTASNTNLIQIGGFRVRQPASVNQLDCIDDIDSMGGGGSLTSITWTGRTDIVVRLQRDSTTLKFWCEVTNADGTGYVAATQLPITGINANASGGLTIGDTISSARVAWVRWYNTSFTSPALSALSPPNSGAVGQLGDWEFSDAATDSSGNSLTMNYSGSATYGDTSLLSPVVTQGTQRSVRVGVQQTLTSAGTYSPNDSQTLTYLWSQVSGPTTLTLGTATAATTTADNWSFGSYVMRVAVTDDGARSTNGDLKYGAVVTDSNGVVSYSDSRLEVILGKQIRWGANPWSWFDDRNKAVADHFAALQAVAPPVGYLDFWNTADTGTLSATNLSNTLTFTGVNPQIKFCGGSGNTTVDSLTNNVIVWYSLGGGAFGRRSYVVQSCPSSTTVTINPAFQQITASGLQYTVATDQGLGTNQLATWINGSTNANYYDNVMAYYALYYRSGIDDYRDYARTLADRWWTMPYVDEGRTCSDDQGFWCLPPRSRGYIGLVLRALDGRSDMWPGLRLWWDYDGNGMNIGAANHLTDLREESAILGSVSLGAIFDPDSTHRTTYTGWVNNVIGGKYASDQQTNKNWITPLYGQVSWNGNPGTVTVSNGSTTITGVGTSWPDLSGFQFWSTDGPNDFWNGGDTREYAVVSNTSTSVVVTPAYIGASASGRGWSFGYVTGLGTQPFLMAYAGLSFSYAYEALKVSFPTNANSAKQFSVDVANWIRIYGYRSATKGLYYARVFNGCEPPETTSDCLVSHGDTDTVDSSRYLAAEIMLALSKAYEFSGNNSTIGTFMDQMYTNLYARTGFTSPIPGDGTDLCGFLCDNSFDLGNNKAKTYGFAFGRGNGAAWPAYRVGTAPGARQITEGRVSSVGRTAN